FQCRRFSNSKTMEHLGNGFGEPLATPTPTSAAGALRPRFKCVGLKPGYIKRAPVAWFCSHRHTAVGLNDAYAYCYLFVYSLCIPPEMKRLTLPQERNLRILAITVSDESSELRPVHALYDTLEHAS